jgi:excisionase family DNA binding protein
MKITYDSELDAMYISFSDAPRAKQQHVNDDTILDLSDSSEVLGIELLDATKNYGSNIVNLDFSLLGDFFRASQLEYTTKEAAIILKVDKETVLRKIRTGELKAKRLGKSYRINKNELDKFIRT